MKLKGPWSIERCERFLLETRLPLRLACNGTSGHPVLASLWFVPEGGKLWCATQQSARVVSLLHADPRCAFELSVESPPYRGVRGRAIATIDPARGERVLRDVIDRYLGDPTTPPAPLLLERVESEVAIALDMQSIVSWDYRDRMGASNE